MKGSSMRLCKALPQAAALLVAITQGSFAWAQSNYISGVPDIVMPPALPQWLQNGNNWCAPTAGANVVKYWDGNGYPGVGGGFANRNLAGEMGWFMDTNDQAVPDDQHLGSHLTDPLASGFDIVNGLANWARWDANNTTFGVNNLPYPGQTPQAKTAYPWAVSLVLANLFGNAVAEIDAGRPVLAAFQHWDMFNTGLAVNVGGNQIQVWDFKAQPQGSIGGSNDDGYWEQDFGLGHMVTGIGYFKNFQYHGNPVDLLIVHDGIGANGLGFVTPVDMAVVVSGPQWFANVNVNPVPEPTTFVAAAAGLAMWIARRRR